MNAASPSAPAPATCREIAIAVAACFALTFAIDATGWAVPWVRANVVALFAAVFLYLPARVMPGDGPTPEALGLTWAGAARPALLGVAVAAVTLVGFVPVHHVWATRTLGQHLSVDAGVYNRPSDRYHGAPVGAGDGVHVFHEADVWYVRWHPASPDWRLEVHSDGEIFRPSGQRLGAPLIVSGDGARPTGTSFRTVGGTYVEVIARLGGAAVAHDAYRLGPAGVAPRDGERSLGVRLRLSRWWIPLAVLFQLALIALPEEYFYRGYLQHRLGDVVRDRRVTLGPVWISTANVVASVLFALGHVIIGWDPARLAVFFPSLLFGWLRERTGSIAAGVVFHAACNLMVQFIAPHYW